MLPVAVARAQTAVISEIQFSGNHVTRERVLRQELTIKVGDPIDNAKLQASRQSIMDLGLFVSVLVDVDEDGVVVFTIKEKHYVLLLPRFSHDDDNNRINPGARLTVNNLAGLNQRLKLTYIQSKPEKADYGKQNELGVEFYYPKINGGTFNLTTSFNIRRAPIQYLQSNAVVAEYDSDELDLRFLVTRWWKRTGPSKGWLTGLGAGFQQKDYRYVSGLTGVFENDRAVSILGQVAFMDIHDYLYSRSGVQYGYNIEQGLKFLGSDYDYNRHLLFYRRYMRLQRAHHNLNVQLRVGLSDGDSDNLGEDVYEINGYGDLRAYTDAVSGDAFALLNIEYLRPVLDKNYVRGLLFVDVGNAYDRFSDIDLADLKWTTGFGLRWRIKGYVDLNVSMEYAYNLDENKSRFYFRTKGAF